MTNEQRQLYSAIIHEELGKGRKPLWLARKLKMTVQDVNAFDSLYLNTCEKYHVYTLDKLLQIREKRQKLLDDIAQKIKRIPYESHAFHMPITLREAQEYNRIATLVAKDEYLPVGYRSPKNPYPIVHNKKRYE